MRVDAIFIGVEVDDEVAKDTEIAAKLTEVCPVDIFAQKDTDATLEIVDKNVDECVLCELCLDASPPGSVKVLKLYEDGAALVRS
jgi:NAD-dependent dihydropyrimidine dehydrogenase PreA subunit